MQNISLCVLSPLYRNIIHINIGLSVFLQVYKIIISLKKTKLPKNHINTIEIHVQKLNGGIKIFWSYLSI